VECSDYVLATEWFRKQGYWIYSDISMVQPANYNTYLFLANLTGDFSYSESFTLTAIAYTVSWLCCSNAALSSTRDIAAVMLDKTVEYASINGGGGF